MSTILRCRSAPGTGHGFMLGLPFGQLDTRQLIRCSFFLLSKGQDESHVHYCQCYLLCCSAEWSSIRSRLRSCVLSLLGVTPRWHDQDSCLPRHSPPLPLPLSTRSSHRPHRLTSIRLRPVSIPTVSVIWLLSSFIHSLYSLMKSCQTQLMTKRVNSSE